MVFLMIGNPWGHSYAGKIGYTSSSTVYSRTNQWDNLFEDAFRQLKNGELVYGEFNPRHEEDIWRLAEEQHYRDVAPYVLRKLEEKVLPAVSSSRAINGIVRMLNTEYGIDRMADILVLLSPRLSYADLEELLDVMYRNSPEKKMIIWERLLDGGDLCKSEREAIVMRLVENNDARDMKSILLLSLPCELRNSHEVELDEKLFKCNPALVAKISAVYLRRELCARLNELVGRIGEMLGTSQIVPGINTAVKAARALAFDSGLGDTLVLKVNASLKKTGRAIVTPDWTGESSSTAKTDELKKGVKEMEALLRHIQAKKTALEKKDVQVPKADGRQQRRKT